MVEALRRPPVPPLPSTREDMALARVLKSRPNLNDAVEKYIIDLWENVAYTKYIDPVWDDQAVEGSTAADNIYAAEVIRKLAQKNEDPFVGDQKITAIVKAMNVVLNRYHQSKKRRRHTLSGEIVPPDTADEGNDGGE